jgi:hypothetical protein
MSHTGTAGTDGAKTRRDGSAADYGRGVPARAGARRLSFRVDPVDETFLLGLPGLVNLEVRRDFVQIQTTDSYVVSKVLVSMATTIPSIVIVLLLGRFYGHVHLLPWQWVAVAVTVWFGATIFAALAVAIGYRYNPDQVQPLSLAVYFTFAILGGLWFPLTGFLGKISELTPTYDAVKIGTDVVGNAAVPVGLAIGLIVWLGIFIALASASVRATAETV